MPAQAYLICESRPAQFPLPTEGTDWEIQARFFIPHPPELAGLLQQFGLADRGHPSHLSSVVSAEILFEDGDIIFKTYLLAHEIQGLALQASVLLVSRLWMWAACLTCLEEENFQARLIIWFIK